MTVLARLIAVAVGGTSLAAMAQADARPVADLASQVETVARGIEAARNAIGLVENQYTLRDEPSDAAARLRRFSDAEIQYLLKDYATASVLFYDLVASKDFQSSPRYPDALHYLADSLYQQKNYLGARLYLRQLLSLKGSWYREALAQYLEIAGRLNEFAGIDDYITEARRLSGGTLPPELTYVYAKWMFRRPDLAVAERVPRAQAMFASLTTEPPGPYHLQAAYFIGVGAVTLKQLDVAARQFQAVAQAPARDERERAVKELAELSLGRVFFELGRYDDAIDHYSRIPQQSENFPDSLYELAWAYVRKGELERAYNATEVLLLVAENSVLAPEAKILQGTLLQKLQRYDDAIETYTQVINTYAQIRDEINARLTVNSDPVAYFDQLLARNESVTEILPPEALKWASTRQDVADAVAITSALEDSRKGLTESRAIADRILRSLEERGLESFPVLQEGYTRADAVDTAVTRAEEQLTDVEMKLTRPVLTGAQAGEALALRQQAAELKRRIDTLPTTTEEVRARRERIQSQIDTLDRTAFQLGLQVQSLVAQLTAIEKYADDTRKDRQSTVEDEKGFVEKVSLEQRALQSMLADVDELRLQLKAERANADKAIGGEARLRDEYLALLAREQAIYASVRGAVPAEAARVLWRADVVRNEAAAVRARVGRSKQVIRERVAQRAEKLKEQVITEQTLIEQYTRETAGVTGETRNLVGRIAFESFQRVRQSFYDLVLKADVGLVDVAFQRKQDKTAQIQKLAAQKDRELRALDEEFSEVLKDVDQ